MAKCENCDSVHWQPQQSSVQVCERETGVEKVKRKWLQRTGPQVLSSTWSSIPFRENFDVRTLVRGPELQVRSSRTVGSELYEPVLAAAIH